MGAARWVNASTEMKNALPKRVNEKAAQGHQVKISSDGQRAGSDRCELAPGKGVVTFSDASTRGGWSKKSKRKSGSFAFI